MSDSKAQPNCGGLGGLTEDTEDTRLGTSDLPGSETFPLWGCPICRGMSPVSLAFTTSCQRHAFPLGDNQKHLQTLLNPPSLGRQTVPPPHWEDYYRGTARRGAGGKAALAHPHGAPQHVIPPPTMHRSPQAPRQWRERLSGLAGRGQASIHTDRLTSL